MKKGVVIFLVLVLSLSLVSAGWLSDFNDFMNRFFGVEEARLNPGFSDAPGEGVVGTVGTGGRPDSGPVVGHGQDGAREGANPADLWVDRAPSGGVPVRSSSGLNTHGVRLWGGSGGGRPASGDPINKKTKTYTCGGDPPCIFDGEKFVEMSSPLYTFPVGEWRYVEPEDYYATWSGPKDNACTWTCNRPRTVRAGNTCVNETYEGEVCVDEDEDGSLAGCSAPYADDPDDNMGDDPALCFERPFSNYQCVYRPMKAPYVNRVRDYYLLDASEFQCPSAPRGYVPAGAGVVGTVNRPVTIAERLEYKAQFKDDPTYSVCAEYNTGDAFFECSEIAFEEKSPEELACEEEGFSFLHLGECTSHDREVGNDGFAAEDRPNSAGVFTRSINSEGKRSSFCCYEDLCEEEGLKLLHFRECSDEDRARTDISVRQIRTGIKGKKLYTCCYDGKMDASNCVDKDGDGYNGIQEIYGRSNLMFYFEDVCGPRDCDDDPDDDREQYLEEQFIWNDFDQDGFLADNVYPGARELCEGKEPYKGRLDSNCDGEYCPIEICDNGIDDDLDGEFDENSGHDDCWCLEGELYHHFINLNERGYECCSDFLHVQDSVDGPGHYSDHKICCKSEAHVYRIKKFYRTDSLLNEEFACCDPSFENPFIGNGTGEYSDKQVCCKSERQFYIDGRGSPHCCDSSFENPFIDNGVGLHSFAKACCESEEQFYIGSAGDPDCCDLDNIYSPIRGGTGCCETNYFNGEGDYEDFQVCCKEGETFHRSSFGYPVCCDSSFENPFIDNGRYSFKDKVICCESEDRFALDRSGDPSCCSSHEKKYADSAVFYYSQKKFLAHSLDCCPQQSLKDGSIELNKLGGGKEVINFQHCCYGDSVPYLSVYDIGGLLGGGSVSFSCCDREKHTFFDYGITYSELPDGRLLLDAVNSGQICCEKGQDHVVIRLNREQVDHYCAESCEKKEDCPPVCGGKFSHTYAPGPSRETARHSELIYRDCSSSINTLFGGREIVKTTGKGKVCIKERDVSLPVAIGTYCVKKVVDGKTQGVISCEECGSSCTEDGRSRITYNCVEGKGCLKDQVIACSVGEICIAPFDRSKGLSVAECVTKDKLKGKGVSFSLSSDLSTTFNYIEGTPIYVADEEGCDEGGHELLKISPENKQLISGFNTFDEMINYLAVYVDFLGDREKIPFLEFSLHGREGLFEEDFFYIPTGEEDVVSGGSFSGQGLIDRYNNDVEFREKMNKIRGKAGGLIVPSCRAGKSRCDSNEVSLLSHALTGLFGTGVLVSKSDVEFVAKTHWSTYKYRRNFLKGQHFVYERPVELTVPEPRDESKVLPGVKRVKAGSAAGRRRKNLKNGLHGQWNEVKTDGTSVDFSKELIKDVLSEGACVIPHQKEGRTVNKVDTIYYLASPRNLFPGFEEVAYHIDAVGGEVYNVIMDIDDPFNEADKNKEIYSLKDEFMMCEAYIESNATFDLSSGDEFFSFEGLAIRLTPETIIQGEPLLKVTKLEVDCTSYFEYLENENKPMTPEFFELVQEYYDSGLIPETSYLDFKRRHDSGSVCETDEECWEKKVGPLGDLGCRITCRRGKCVSEYDSFTEVCDPADEECGEGFKLICLRQRERRVKEAVYDEHDVGDSYQGYTVVDKEIRETRIFWLWTWTRYYLVLEKEREASCGARNCPWRYKVVGREKC